MFSILLISLVGIVVNFCTVYGDANQPRDCQSLHTAGISKSGEYTIWINGDTPTVVFCDMATEGGGWTVFQRRVDGNTDFDREWNDYKVGFGNKSRNFWLGNDAIHELTKNGASLLIDLFLYDGRKLFALYKKFRVGHETEKYKLEISGFSGNLTDDFGNGYNSHNEMCFSTKDRDNDQSENGNCAVEFKSGWWHNACFRTNLNSLYPGDSVGGSSYIFWASLYGTAITNTEMKIRRNIAVTTTPTVNSLVTRSAPKTDQSGLDSGCKSYRVLSDAARLYTEKNSHNSSCDSNLHGWYRFMYNAGNRMLDACPASNEGSRLACGSEWQGWLDGSHPNENEGMVNRTVCFSTVNNCTCRFQKIVQVRNCGQYYLYFFDGVPKCEQRYCGARDKRAVVSCTDNFIRIELNKKYFNASLYGSITLRDKSCTASYSNGNIILGSLPNSCGATMKETPNEIIYENEVIMKARMSGSEVISRDHDQSINIRCAYKRSGYVGTSFDPIMSYSGFESGVGKFQFNFAMYQSETFLNRHYKYPVEVNTRDRLYFQMSSIVQDSRLQLLIDQCYSTPNMNRTYHNKYTIINDGCQVDNTVKFHGSQPQLQRFSMDAFRYLSNTTTVYIHCLVFLCHKSSSLAKCKQSCSGSNDRVKREVTEDFVSDPGTVSKYYLLEVGPVVHKGKEKRDNVIEHNEFDVKIVILAVGFAAMTVVVAVLIFKRRRQKQSTENEAREVGIDNQIGKMATADENVGRIGKSEFMEKTI